MDPRNDHSHLLTAGCRLTSCSHRRAACGLAARRVHAGVTVVFGAQKLVVEVEAGSSTFRLVEGLLVRE